MDRLNNNKKSLKNYIHKYFNDNDWNKDNKLDLTTNLPNKNFRASISLQDWKIKIDLNQDFGKKLQKLFKNTSNSNEIIENMIYTIIKHEKSHWEICPKDIIYHNAISQTVINRLEENPQNLSKDNNTKQQEANIILAMFSDIIVNLSNVKDKKFIDGASSIYLNFYYSEEQSIKKDPLFFAFVYSQINFLDNTDQKKLRIFEQIMDNNEKPSILERNNINKYNNKNDLILKSDDKSLEKLSKQILSIFVGDNIANKAFNKEKLSEQEINNALIKIKNEKYWKEIAINFTDLISRLPKSDFNSITKLLSSDLSSDSLKNKMDFKKYDDIYRRQAEEIILKYENDLKYKIYLKTELNKSKKINLNKIALNKTLLIKNKLNIFNKINPYNININSNLNRDLLFVVDVSGSMGWKGKPLDNSPYDISIRSMYSVFAYLQKQKQTSNLNFGLIQFSSETDWSGWKNFNNLVKLKTDIFKNYQGGGTTLDISKLKEAFASATNKYTVILISDGVIGNESKVMNFLENKIKTNEVIFFKINEMNSTGSDYSTNFIKKFKKLNGTVIELNKPEDLINKVIDINIRK